MSISFFRGNLGNKMFIYALLYVFKLKYGYDIYVSKVVHDHLNYVFENLGNVQNVFCFRRLDNYRVSTKKVQFSFPVRRAKVNFFCGHPVVLL